MNGRWHSVTEICTYLGVNRETVYNWIKAKDFPAHRVGKLYKFKLAEIDEWVKKKDKS